MNPPYPSVFCLITARVFVLCQPKPALPPMLSTSNAVVTSRTGCIPPVLCLWSPLPFPFFPPLTFGLLAVLILLWCLQTFSQGYDLFYGYVVSVHIAPYQWDSPVQSSPFNILCNCIVTVIFIAITHAMYFVHSFIVHLTMDRCKQQRKQRFCAFFMLSS